MRFLLAGDAIYSAKHLVGFMKEAFAEDMLARGREDGALRRRRAPGADGELGGDGSASADVAARRSRSRPRPFLVRLSAGRRAVHGARAARAGYIPPPTAEELAEMDGAGDKTQIVDSTHTFQCARAGSPTAASSWMTASRADRRTPSTGPGSHQRLALRA